MNGFSLRYNEYLEEFEKYAIKYMNAIQTNPTLLGESMCYSMLNGGKRIRPVLALACADVVGLAHEEILPFAFGKGDLE